MSSRVGMISAAFIASLATLNRHLGQHLFLRIRISVTARTGAGCQDNNYQSDLFVANTARMWIGIVAVPLVMGPTSMASIAILLPAASSTAIIGRIPSALDGASR